MKHKLLEPTHIRHTHRRWPFAITVIIIGILSSALSESLTLGPSWIMLVLVVLLLIPMYAALYQGHSIWLRRMGLTITAVVTLGLITNVLFLIHALFAHTESAATLFRNSVLLWSANILVFSIWYWEVDQGGPLRRHSPSPGPRDFLFPQSAIALEEWANWQPRFTDYVFLAFNTSTAFSPTDTMALSRSSKLLMMTQSSISLAIVVVLAARAINIIP